MGTVRKLIVEVVDAHNLAPKDGHGTSSPYVVVDFYGQRRKTRTAIRDLNPVWNETLSFNVGAHNDIFGDMLELDIYHDKNYGSTRRNNSLGRIRLSSTQFVKKGEEALIYYELEKKHFLSMIQGEIGLKIYYADEPVPPPVPPEQQAPPPPQKEEAPPQETEKKPPAEPEKVEEPQAAPSEQPPEGDKPNEEAPAKEKENAEPPAPPEAEKPPEPEPKPEPTQPLESSDQVEPLSPKAPVQPDVDLDVKAASVLRSNSEIRFSGMNGPQPMRRSASTASFTSEVSTESMLIERSSFDLVEKMHYLFIHVVKARYLPTNGNPVVKIAVSSHHVTSRPARKTTVFEWNQTFAFGRDVPDSSSILEVSVWDPRDHVADADGRNLLGGVCFDVNEIPVRDPPDSPLAPQWYRLEGGGALHGDLMIATWVGTQADESFPDAWKSDTYGHVNSKAKVYQSPKLWYLRATVLEAQDVMPLTLKEACLQVKAQLGFQVLKSKTAITRNGNVSWNEDFLFVVAEPVSDHLVFTLENRQHKAPVTMGVLKISPAGIERRVDDRNVPSRWFTFDNPNEENNKSSYKGRVHLRLCFDGGYHVMDEAAHVCSDYRPTARQLWKPPVGTVELGIIGCKNLIPMKTVNGKSSTDAYCVAKYGKKWVRTRTVSENLEPKWNEQYTWKVYDPCTVLTIGVFDSWQLFELDRDNPNESTRPDFRIGKVRIRISTLQTGRVYRNTYPLLVLTPSGLKKMGEIEIAIRFVRTTQRLDFLHVYSQPMLPLMHHIKPLGVVHQEVLRNTAVRMVAGHLSRSEPPLRKEVVFYMLDADSHNFSIRKVRANWYRIINVVAGVIDILRWIEDTRGWKNPTATILVHALLVMLVWFPDLIIPTFAFYIFVVGAWNYRFRARDPLPHFDPKISLAEVVDREELDEEFDAVPSTRPSEVVRARYDKLRTLGARVQTVLGDFATQGERVQALVTWRDPRATGIFVFLCLVVALILYLVPSKMVAMASGFYYLRHPIFRDRLPSPALNFFRRLPSLSDRIM
ncbi:hypothetical protein VNO77_34115 [Canavalia gladiata]|uniref:C2 domain-containing protein n=1 Tax=Canavalia gladiata TaxID=3824 RepID=A0AAN9KG68_CANGL